MLNDRPALHAAQRGNAAGWRNMQAEAFAFVQAELARFRGERDDKLVKRYERLANYFRSRGSTRKAP